MDIDAQTRLVSLIGDPVEHSLSPRIHNAAFEAQGVNAVYVATRVRPAMIEKAVDGIRALQFLGANVTVPHKKAVRPLLDDVSDRAKAVGAVNTIVRVNQENSSDQLWGDNTDVDGFLDPLVATVGEDLEGSSMLVFGAGGAARAVVFALLDQYQPHELTIVARRPAQAEALAVDLDGYDVRDALRVSTFDDAGPYVRSSRLLVNATPLGMAPEYRDQTPWPNADDFGPDQLVYDLVYTPETTRFLQDADDEGAATIGGLDMLVGQANAAYEQWTGREMPTEVVRTALRSRQQQ